jgi:hypothetical protein
MIEKYCFFDLFCIQYKLFNKVRLKIISLIILVLLLGAGYFVSTGHYSKGERAGTVSKLSERGYIFKTNEGLLNEGGFSGETGSLTQRNWEFSAKSDSVVSKLKKALATGERVTLLYQEKFLQFAWNGDTKYFITDVLFLPVPMQPAVQQLLNPEPVVAPTSPAVADTLL